MTKEDFETQLYTNLHNLVQEIVYNCYNSIERESELQHCYNNAIALINEQYKPNPEEEKC